MTQARGAAERWLDRIYGGTVQSTRFPLLETPRVAVFGCRFRNGTTPMLAAAIAVPTNGDTPYLLPNDRPFGDLGIGEDTPTPWHAPRDWAHRVNARNCVLALDAVVDRTPTSAAPWQPQDERPDWWTRLLRHFPTPEVSTCENWHDALSAVADATPDTRGVIWIRRELAGVEVTGHLLYAHNNNGTVAVLDALTGTPADLETATVSTLTLARFHRPRPTE